MIKLQFCSRKYAALRGVDDWAVDDDLSLLDRQQVSGGGSQDIFFGLQRAGF
jgi:hypothetical protein